jgi:hypothetical protein
VEGWGFEPQLVAGLLPPLPAAGGRPSVIGHTLFPHIKTYQFINKKTIKFNNLTNWYEFLRAPCPYRCREII